jgi:transposase
VQADREQWVEWQAELTETDLKRLVFWDEAAVLTTMTLLYGRSLPGERIVEYVPHGDWERLTVAAGIRLGGVCGAMTYEGGTTAEAAATFADGCLGAELLPGDIVILDRLSSHSDPAVLQALQRRGVQVKQLPAYSPDLNPVEKVWSKVKQAVRRARPRTIEELNAAVAASLRAITPEDIKGWFEHCGYHTDA